MRTIIEDGFLKLYPEGKMDSNNSELINKEINDLINAHPDSKPVIDADGLNYISSSGIRVLFNLQKRMGAEKITIFNVNRDVYDILEMTGITRIMNIEKKLRNISISNAEVIGKGRSSSVYRFEDETIIKLYTDGVPLSKIRQELRLAKNAFLAGIPTPVSYDLVRCGEAYGVVFEMLDHADTVGHTLTANPDKFDDIMKKFVAAYKLIHQTSIKDMGGFESVKETWNRWADGMMENGSYTAEEADCLKKMIAAVPDRDTMVHCDYHAGNVMYQKDEIVVIDMADVGFGHPIFDLAAGAFHARYSASETRQKVHGMNQENMLRFWDTLLTMYFDIKDKNTFDEIKEMCDAFGLLRGALFPMKHVQISPDLKAFHVEETRKNLLSRMDWALSQADRLNKYFQVV